MDHSKFEDMTHSLTGKVIIDKIVVDFEILDSFKMISTKMSALYYVDHVEIRVLAKKRQVRKFHLNINGKPLNVFGKMKYRLH